MGLGLLNTTIIQTKDSGITFDIRDLYKITKTGYRQDKYIQVIKKEIQNLFNKQFSIADSETGEFNVYNWLSHLKGNFNNTEITLHFGHEIMQLFSNIQGNYTQCLLKNIILLKSNHAIRIYEYAMQYKPGFAEIPEFTIDQFRKYLGIED